MRRSILPLSLLLFFSCSLTGNPRINLKETPKEVGEKREIQEILIDQEEEKKPIAPIREHIPSQI